MKIVQIGILAALVVVGALLFMVWRGQQPAPTPAGAPAAQTSENVAAPPAAAPASGQPAPAAQTTSGKPSPASGWKKAVPASGKTESPAAWQTPASLQPSPAAPSAPPTPSPATPPQAPQPPVQPAPVAPPPPQPRTVTLAAGTLLPVRLGETLSTDKLKAGDSFTATLDKPLIVEGLVIAERGARLDGRVLEAEQAGRVKGVSMLAIHLVSLRTSDGQLVRVSTDPFRKQGETTKAEDAKKVGIGAGIGAAIGAIAGGGKGAAIGAGIGGAAGAGTVAATRGKEVVLPVETRLDFRLSSAVTLTEKQQ